ncbi:MAG: ACP phosphodiesterase [Calditrichia bacterium]
MNYLAHLFLADDTAESRIGNMLGDFVTPETELQFSPEIRKGIALHRAVDKFTDSHPVFLRSKSRISDDFRLLKGIMIDIFYDHFLAKNWENYADQPLELFAEEVYRQFSNHFEMLPPRMQHMMPVMIRGNWLVTYREIRGIAWVLKGMSGRISRPEYFTSRDTLTHRKICRVRNRFCGIFCGAATIRQGCEARVVNFCKILIYRLFSRNQSSIL